MRSTVWALLSLLIGSVAVAHDLHRRQIRGLSPAAQTQFLIGHSLFTDPWVIAPASTTARDGLGPLFNARACGSCHRDGGRGQVTTDKSPISLVLRFDDHPAFGGQLQPLATIGDGEGQFRVEYLEETGRYPDGTPWRRHRPQYRWHTGEPVAGASARLAQPLYGLGLLAAIPEAALLARADPNDADGDGISGRPHWVTAADGTRSLGRFGHKALHPTVIQQVAHAFRNDLGITNRLYPDQPCEPTQTACLAAPSGADPRTGVELADDLLAAVSMMTASLGIPRPVNPLSRTERVQGAALFGAVGCDGCHVPRVTTGAATALAFAHQAIAPYSDLLLHDLGDALADDVAEGDARGREWRTAPLWGLGALPTDRQFLLHDGRARSVEEAILWHDGEAAGAKRRFMHLDRAARAALLRFVAGL